jgi:hypothetical protein
VIEGAVQIKGTMARVAPDRASHIFRRDARHLLERIKCEAFFLRSPDFADIFVWREALQRLERP